MLLFRGAKAIQGLYSQAVATVGNFDGVHRGHQALLAALRLQANRLQLPLLVVLFEPQPGEYFKGKQAPARLSSLREKLQVLRQCGVDYVCCLKFDKDLAVMSPEAFAEKLFASLHIRYLLIGQDFRFGKDRRGDVMLLQQLVAKRPCTVEVFPDFSKGEERVSSTKVREALAHAQLNRAAELLGRSYNICGRVIAGAGRGRQWGIPTANLALHRLTLPLQGVFFVQVKKEQRWLSGVANIGSRPTVDGTKNVLEVHLLNFDEPLYGELLQVFFLHKLRDEIKFSSVEDLIVQIQQDVAAAVAYFSIQPEIPTLLSELPSQTNDLQSRFK